MSERLPFDESVLYQENYPPQTMINLVLRAYSKEASRLTQELMVESGVILAEDINE